MALLRFEAADAISTELRERLVRLPVPRGTGAGRDAQFQGLAAGPTETLPVAVGVSRLPGEAGFSVAIRVQGNSEPARREAQRLRELAEARGASVDMAEFQEARLPTSTELKAQEGHPLLCAATEAISIGLSIGQVNAGAGTLGCFVEQDGAPALLSCSHVLADSGLIARETFIHHPGKPDAPFLGGKTRIAKLGEDFVEFGQDDNEIDAALAPLLKPERMVGNRVPAGLGSPYDGRKLNGVVPRAELSVLLGQRVGKVGRTTGYTEGTLRSVLELVRVFHPRLGSAVKFVNVLEVVADDDRPFTKAGDSGAAVFLLSDLRVVGLHFASPGPISYACPLERVLERFKVAWL